ncbi:MAG: hypothetical protein C4529_00150 [Deltaproteobacteria bacterium]|nr:MAG: hypothetical protein C4529_00150 [Deltaproteobacteria bacterium]
MADLSEGNDVLSVTCPCCGASLAIDRERGEVVGSEPSGHARAGVELKDATKILEKESAQIREKFEKIVQADKTRGAELDKLFRSHLEKTGEEPPQRPLRDIDLD